MSSSLAGFVEVDEVIGKVLTLADRKHSQFAYNAPQYIHDLLTDIRKLGVLTRHAAKLFPTLEVFNGEESDRLSSILKSINDIFVDINRGLRYATGFENRHMAVESTCRLYSCRLKDLHISLVDGLESLRRESIKRMLLCIQEPNDLDFCQVASDELSGYAELACLPSPQESTMAPETHGAPEIRTASSGKDRSRESSRINVSLIRVPSGSCHGECKCRCHSSPPKKCPQGLRRRFRQLFPNAKSDPAIVLRCSRVSCRKNTTHQGRVLVLCSMFVNRAIMISTISRGLKIKAHLKIYRIVRESSEIIRYIQLNNVDGVKRMILGGQAHPDDMGDDGWSLLHTAAYEGYLEIAKFLISVGASTDISENKSRKASHFAKFKALKANATAIEVETAKIFPDEKDFRYDFELSPVLSAVLKEYDSADLERPDLSALIEVAELARDTHDGEDWSMWRQKYRHRSLLFQDLIAPFQEANMDEGAKVEQFHQIMNQPDILQKWTPLQWAAYVGRTDEFINLLLHGADPFAITPSGRNVVHHAADSDADGILLYLLQNGYHERGLDVNLPDIWGETPLHIAAARSPSCAVILLKNGASINAKASEEQTPLHHLRYVQCTERRLKCLQVLLEHGPDVDIREEGGRSAIFYFLGTPECVTTLLDYGADISIRDSDGRNILHYACIEDRSQLLNTLLSRSTRESMTWEDKNGNCPLLICFQYQRVSCARILLERTPITSRKDKNGWTFIHHAAEMGDPIVLQLVLSVPGEGVFSKNASGQTPIDIARVKGNFHGRFGRILSDTMDRNPDNIGSLVE